MRSGPLSTTSHILVAITLAALPGACGKQRPFGVLEGGPDTSAMLGDGDAGRSPERAVGSAPDDPNPRADEETWQPENFYRMGANAAASGAEVGVCEDGAVQPCGPEVENGPCRFGSRGCMNGVWGQCIGAILPGERECGSAADNDCDGTPDDAIDAFCQCAVDSIEPCEEHADLDGRGPCRAGSRRCLLEPNTGGAQWGPCVGSVGPLASDSCEVAADDSNCNGVPNEACPCVDGESVACGPSSAKGICELGASTCVDSAFTECAGAVFPRRRDCTSELDNDCDGATDNTVDNICTCVVGDSQACGTHPGRDGNGICRAGTRVCGFGSNGATAQFGPCEGSIGPGPADSCTAPGDDSNCDGVANGNCECIAGERTTCGQEHGSLGVCSTRTLVCNNSGRWPAASACAPSSQEICDNTLDDDCDGFANEPDACDECSETCFCEDGSCAELVAIDSGDDTVCVLTAIGNVWCWGRNDAGQVGAPGFLSQLRPRRVDQVAGARVVAVGTRFSCALQADQSVVCWGSNANGQLGDNGNVDLSVLPVQVLDVSNSTLSGVSKIVAGTNFACAMRGNDGSVLCWGNVVGDGRSVGVPSPVAVAVRRSANSVLLGVGDIEAGGSFAIARTGTNWVSWGRSGDELGQGNVLVSVFAAPLSPPSPALVAASAGSRNACGTTAGGDAYCWGNDGILAGLGANDEVDVPTRFPALDDTRSLALGDVVGLATDNNGTLRAFGNADTPASALGQSVDGDVPPTPIPAIGPVKVATVGGVLGANFACAVLVDNTVSCWGQNNQGQLGNGTTTNAVAPTPVLPTRE